ncbi:hypothetical protein [Sinorhizobium meliloti]|uniref:hypothetical protein n=1 Tax=Rhizobium meliloti TaxID=382 RepID=UPI001072C83D|nr:hypothetical protein [Sinorhizobium meliloti]MQW25146.1 hypothetical protein [Sinorhizobium meliloti]
MAVSAPIVAASAGTGFATVTTSSFTPAASSLLIAFVVARGSGAGIPNAISDSLGGTWTALSAGNVVGNSAARLYAREVGSSAAMTVSATRSGGTQTAIVILQFTGAGTDFSNFQAVVASTGTSHTANMAAYASGSQVVGFVTTNSGTAQPPPSGFTEIYDNNPTTNTRIQVQHASGATAPTAITWTTSSSSTVAFGLEVKEGSSGIGGSFNDYNEPNSPFLVGPYSSSVSANTITMNFGPEFTGRVLSVFLYAEDSFNSIMPLESATIGGVAATLTPATGIANVYLATAEGVSGTSGNIVVTPSFGQIARTIGLAAYALNGANPIPISAGSQMSGTSTSFDVPANGQVMFYGRGDGDLTGDLIGLDLDGDQWTVDDKTLVWGSRTFTSAAVGHTVSLVDTSGSPLMAWAVFEPSSTPPSGSSIVKVWTGGAWHTSTVKVFIGGSWVTKTLKARKGGNWY